jgi:hypothetical protein
MYATFIAYIEHIFHQLCFLERKKRELEVIAEPPAAYLAACEYPSQLLKSMISTFLKLKRASLRMGRGTQLSLAQCQDAYARIFKGQEEAERHKSKKRSEKFRSAEEWRTRVSAAPLLTTWSAAMVTSPTPLPRRLRVT